MKKTIAILSTVLAMIACTKEFTSPEVPSNASISDLVFNFTARYPAETKAVKAGWENGDKVFVFFQDVTTGYLTLSYDGSWTPAFAGTATVDDLTESGNSFVAVYLPYGNDAAATYDSGWTFTAGKTDSYYLSASDSYTVNKAGGVTTLSADFNMVVPSGYVQFFIPDAEATGVISMSCNAVSPAGVASISSGGVITETAGTQGAFMTGYAATVNSEKGYYFSGKVAGSPGNDYYFAIEMAGKYYDFYKHLNTPLAERAAIKLSTKNQVGAGHYVKIGSTLWSTVNLAAEKPWTYTQTKSNGWNCTNPAQWAGMGLSSVESIPGLDQMNELKTNTDGHRFGMSIAGVNGVLWVCASDETKYIFFPCESDTNYFWSRTVSDSSNGGFTRFYYPSGGVDIVASGGLSNSMSVRTVLGPKSLSSVTTDDLGKVIGLDGKIYENAASATSFGTTAVALICYVGSETYEDAPYNHGLAMALSDCGTGSSSYQWKTAETSAGHSASPYNTTKGGLQYRDSTHNTDEYPAFQAAFSNNGTAKPTGCSDWFLATYDQYSKMVGALANAIGNGWYYEFNNAFESRGGANITSASWTSTEIDDSQARVRLSNGTWWSQPKTYSRSVRSTLAF